MRSLIRFALGAVLVIAGLSKLTHLTQFVAAFSMMPYFSWQGWRSLSMLLPAAEIIVGLRLILDPADLTAARTALVLYAAFLAYQFLVASRTGLFGRPANDCPCFTFGSGAPSPQIVYIVRNALFLGAAVFAVLPVAGSRRPSASTGGSLAQAAERRSDA